jgi:hypothetical protein
MAAIITNNFRLNNAEQFHESFSETASTKYYLFVGRHQPYSASTGGGTDASPPTPLDNVNDERMYFRDMFAAKRITSSAISFAITRHNWVTGTVYDMYRGDYGQTVNAAVVKTANGNIDPFAATSKMWVLNSENNVYKCLWNNGGAASTQEPSGTGTAELSTADNYVWKFMYSLTTTEITDFLTTDFMPVHTDSTVAAVAVQGEIRHYIIANGGAGYTNGTYTANIVKGDATTNATFNVTVSGNSVTSVVPVDAGSGYTFADLAIDDITGIHPGTVSTSAVVVPMISPKGGHGSDAIKELGGFFVITNTSIAGTAGSGDFIVDQDFRRIGLVRNPYNYGSTTVSTADTLSALKTMTLKSSPTPGSFIVDEVITGGTSGAKGVVVHWDASSRVLKYAQTQWTGVNTTSGATYGNLIDFQTNESITSASSATGDIDTLGSPEIDYYSGDVIYVENRAPITRAADQTENIKLIIEF